MTVEWPDAWTQKPFRELLELKYGKALPDRIRRPGSVPVYGSNGQVGTHNVSSVTGPAIIVGRKGSVGKLNFEPGPCWPIDTTYYIDTTPLDWAFTLKLLQRLGLDHMDKSTAIPGLSRSDVYELTVAYPERREQEEIVRFIESAESLLASASDRLQALPALLKKFRQSVLAAACSGQLTADWRESNGVLTSIDRFVQELETARLLHGAKTPKNAQSEPTPVFDVPATWRWVCLRSLVDLKGGVTKGEKRKAGEKLVTVPYLRVANVQRGFLDLREIKFIEATPNDLEELRLQPNDLLFNEGGDRDKLGRGWVWEGQIEDCIHQNHVFRGRLFDARIPAKLVSHYGNSIGAQHFIDEGKQTVNLASLSITKLGDMAFPLAPPEEMVEIMRRIESLFALADSVESRLADATAQVERTTQAILAKAFRGELL